MHDVKKQITAALQKTLRELGIDEKPSLSVPSSSEHGDYTTNIALVASKKAKKNPMELAEEIAQRLKMENIERIETVKPGFINFYLSKKYLLSQLSEAGKTDPNGSLKGKRLMVEFAHPNTHKAFHIGHLRNITIGESIVRLLEANGATMIRANYQGDVGMHIAKCLYGILQNSELKKKSITEKVNFLGKAYAAGSKAFEKDLPAARLPDGQGRQVSAKAEIKDLNALIYASAQKFAKERGIDPGTTDYLALVKPENRNRLDEVYQLWKETRQWSLDYFESIYNRVYTHYDRYYFESECLAGVNLAKEAVKKGVLKESEGAIIFDGKPYGLHTRVFVNSLGLPTYEAKELALAQKEFGEFGNLDKVIHVVGPEQASFFSVTFKVEELLDAERYKDKQFHLVYGWVKLKKGKMSSRTGNVVLGEWLLDEAKAQIKEQFPDMEEDTLEKVAIGAVKYSMLRFSLNSDISFSFEESISLEGNSGPYLQYTYARTQSVLTKVKSPASPAMSADRQAGRQKSKLEPEELMLLRLLSRFDEVVAEAAQQFAPNILCNYLFTLAQAFNLFYQKHKILESEQKDFRLALTVGTGEILSKGLYLLGIEAPKRM